MISAVAGAQLGKLEGAQKKGEGKTSSLSQSASPAKDFPSPFAAKLETVMDLANSKKSVDANALAKKNTTPTNNKTKGPAKDTKHLDKAQLQPVKPQFNKRVADDDEDTDSSDDDNTAVANYSALRQQMLAGLKNLESLTALVDTRGIGSDAALASNNIYNQLISKVEIQAGEKSAQKDLAFESRVAKTEVEQNLIDDFVTDMKRAVGVQPQDLAKAISSAVDGLSPDKMNKSVDKLVDLLNLKGPDEDAARDLYKTLLKDMGSLQDGRLIQALGPRETSFVTDASALGAKIFANQSLNDRSLGNPFENSSIQNLAYQGAAYADGALPVDDMQLTNMTKVSNAPQMAAQSYAKSLQLAMEGAASPTPSVATNAHNAASAVNPSYQAFGALYGEGDAGESSDSSDFSESPNSMAAADKLAANQMGSKPVEFQSVDKAEAAKGTSSEPEVNVNQLMEQTRMIARKGGGEMKVQMNPEGLGKVNLKVDVNDGKVSVQIMAENSDTKKLIESKIGDLKSQLESQKLNLDIFKVEVAHHSSNLADMMQQQFNRNQAHDFLSNFRDQTNNFRQSFMDPLGIRESRDPNESRSKGRGPSDLSTQRPTSTRRLDLVA